MQNNHYLMEIAFDSVSPWILGLVALLGLMLLWRLKAMRSPNKKRRRLQTGTDTQVLRELLKEVQEIKQLLQQFTAEQHPLSPEQRLPFPSTTPEEQEYQTEQSLVEEWEETYQSLSSASQQRLVEWNIWFRTLMLQWRDTYANRNPTEWGPQSLTNLDVALHSPLDIPSEVEKASHTLFGILRDVRAVRLKELKERDIQRIEGISGTTQALKGVIEWDEIDSHLVRPAYPEQERRFHSILPGSGGYRYKGGVLKPTKAIFYGKWDEAPSPTERWVQP